MATKVNHDKITETAKALLDEIRKCAETYTTPADLHELTQAFAAVVDASPNGWSDTGRKVTVR